MKPNPSSRATIRILLIWIVLLLMCISCGGGSPPDDPIIPPGNGDDDGNNDNGDDQVTVSVEFRGSFPTVCAEDVVLYDNYLYVADGPGGIKIINVSNPASPTLVKSMSTTYAIRVYVFGGHLYLCDSSAGFAVYALAIPSDPLRTYSEDTEWATSAAFHNNYLFIGDYYAGFRMYSISNPSSPSLISTFTPNRVRDVDFAGETLLVSDPHFGLATYWFESVNNPVCTYCDGSRTGNFEDIIGRDGFAIVARNDEASRISVFYVGDLATIGLASEYFPTRFIDSLTRTDDLLVVACGEDGVIGYDISELPTLEKVWEVDTPGYARRAKVVGDYLYVADMRGIAIYELVESGGGS